MIIIVVREMGGSSELSALRERHSSGPPTNIINKWILLCNLKLVIPLSLLCLVTLREARLLVNAWGSWHSEMLLLLLANCLNNIICVTMLIIIIPSNGRRLTSRVVLLPKLRIIRVIATVVLLKLLHRWIVEVLTVVTWLCCNVGGFGKWQLLKLVCTIQVIIAIIIVIVC